VEEGDEVDILRSPDAVESFVLDQRQGRFGVRNVESFVWLPAGTPGAHIDTVPVQVAEEVGAVGVALADERHVVDARLGIRPINTRICCQLNAYGLCAD